MTHEQLAWANAANAAFAPTREWRVALLFYAAVHAVNHVKFGPAQAPDWFKHEHRRDFVKARLANIRVKYKALEDLSVIARYDADGHPMRETEEIEAQNDALAVFRACGLC